MKVKMLRTIKGKAGKLYRSHIVTLDDRYAEELIKKGFARKVTGDIETNIEIEEVELNVEVPEEIKIDYNKLTVAELKEIAKTEGIVGYWDLRKKELIEAIKAVVK